MTEVDIINDEIMYFDIVDDDKIFTIEKKFNGYKAILMFKEYNCYLSEKEWKFHRDKFVLNVSIALIKDSNRNNLSNADFDITYLDSGISHLYWFKTTFFEAVKFLTIRYTNACIMVGGADKRRFELYKKVLIPFGFKLKNNSKSHKQNYLYYEII
jgi:hypothetical protein